jgi:hypothetical protein
LIQPDAHGSLPLHEATENSSIQGFKMVFGYGIRYYPEKKGISILFKKKDSINGDTPFQLACGNFGYEEVMKILEDTLSTRLALTTPINVEEALIMAAIDENIHLDCVYFLVRRQPDILQKLLSQSSPSPSPSPSTSVVSSSNNDNKNNRDDDDDDDDNDDDNDSLPKKGRKRKRRNIKIFYYNTSRRRGQKTPQ